MTTPINNISNKREIKKVNEFEKYCEWLATPKQSRKPKTLIALSQVLGVSNVLLWQWGHLPQCQQAVRDCIKSAGLSSAGSIYRNLEKQLEKGKINPALLDHYADRILDLPAPNKNGQNINISFRQNIDKDISGAVIDVSPAVEAGKPAQEALEQAVQGADEPGAVPESGGKSE